MKKFLFLMLSLILMGGANSVKAQAETDITTLSWVNKGQACTQDFNNAEGSTVYGTDAGGASISYVDVSAYGTIKLYGTKSQRARLFINRAEAGDDNGTFYVDINTDGVGTFDCNTILDKQPTAQYIHLNGVKAESWSSSLNLSSITVSGSAIDFPEEFIVPEGEVEITSLSWVNQGQSLTNNLGKLTSAPIYGTDAGPSDGNLSYIDATDYSAVKLYGPDGTVRLFINRAEYPSGTFQFYVNITDGVGTLNFSDVFTAQDGATYIHINGVKAASPGAEAQVDHITLVEKPFEFPEGVADLTKLPYVNKGQGCVNNLGTSTDATIYGTDAGPDGNNLSYIDVTNYSAVKLYGAAGDVVRLFINRAEYVSGTYQFFVTIGEDGVGTLNLADVYAAQSGATYVHLNGLKASQTWAATPDADGKALVKYIGVANASVATIGSTGWTTFASPYALNLSSMTASEGDVAAYYASNVGVGNVTMTSTESDAVAAGTGLMLKGTPGATITIPVAASAGTAISGNRLVGCTTETILSANANYYVLVNNGGTAEFQRLDTHGATIPAGKAYLDVTGMNPARALRITFDDITGVNQVEAASEDEVKEGKFIENGKLVIVKNGQKYNAAGAKLY